jgi:formate dehydrogenase major subunit
MDYNRRDLLKVSGTGVLGLSLMQLGVDITPVQGYTATLKTADCREILNICPFCSLNCHIIASIKKARDKDP